VIFVSYFSQLYDEYNVYEAAANCRGIGFSHGLSAQIGFSHDDYQSQVGATKRPENIVIG
jgi:hypothetical protein